MARVLPTSKISYNTGIKLMAKVDIAGLKIDAPTKTQLLAELAERLRRGQQTFICTPYSEFLYAGLRHPEVLAMLNQFDYAVADGVGVLWAARFLHLPLTAKSYFGRIFQAYWQAVYSGAEILFNPRALRKILPEKIAGADLVWDLAKMAAENSYSVYLLGGFGSTPQLAAEKLETYLLTTYLPGRQAGNLQLKLAGYSNKNPDDLTAIADIQKAKPDFLFVAYGPIKQESWLMQYKNQLPVKLAVGLGGTFDYLAGARRSPPKFIRGIGLEWLYRLFTQPHRTGRIYRATFGLISLLVRHKVFSTYPFRQNAVAIIFNQAGQVLVNQRAPDNFKVDIMGGITKAKRMNYWQFPQGGVDAGESVINAAKREAREETGLENLQFIKVSSSVNAYFWNNALRKFWANREFKNCGQKQHVAYFRYLGNDSGVRVDMHEFVAYKWVEVKGLDKIVHEERRAVAKIVQQDFPGLMERLKLDKI